MKDTVTIGTRLRDKRTGATATIFKIYGAPYHGNGNKKPKREKVAILRYERRRVDKESACAVGYLKRLIARGEFELIA